jgi:phosphoribosylanthranilate isomerase
VGFNFFPPSPRFVMPAQAAALSARRSAEAAQRVGLFVEPEDAQIAAALSALPLDVLQLYAAPDRVAEIAARFGVPVWRSVGVATSADLPRAPEGVAAFLIEPKPPPAATRPGGNAIALEWSVTAGWQAPSPWVLAGGLTPDNVAAAIAASGAEAVDVSSGVERARGVKDPQLIRNFIAAARTG